MDVFYYAVGGLCGVCAAAAFFIFYSTVKTTIELGPKPIGMGLYNWYFTLAGFVMSWFTFMAGAAFAFGAYVAVFRLP